MNNDQFTVTSLACQEQAMLQEEILDGKFGNPGEVFLTTRSLAQLRHVSVVTAHNILCGLCASGYLELRGKRYYLTHSELMTERQNRSNVIGLLLPKLNNEFYSSLAEAVVASAERCAYRVLIMTTSFNTDNVDISLQLMLNSGVAGIINCVPISTQTEHLYQNCKIPCVMLGDSLDKCSISSVQVNSFSISQKVAQNLVEEGYRRFFYLGTTKRKAENDIRFMAFQMELKHQGYTLEDRDILRITTDSKEDEKFLQQRLEEINEPVGIFCYHDLLAVKVYQVCSRLGKSIPYDVGVIGFDDLSIASSLYPALTTVQYRLTTMADMAFSLLLDRIKSPNAQYDNYYIEPNLVVRKSASLYSGGKP